MRPGSGAAESGGRAGAPAGPGRPGAVPEWVRRLRPPVPTEVAELLVLAEDDDDPAASRSTEVLADGALSALDRALAGKESREAAWDLLGADALLTCACHRALDRSDPEAVLDVLVGRVAGARGPAKEAGDRD